VPWEDAAKLNISLQLPSKFELDEESLNTGAIACNGMVYTARWDYKIRYPSGLQESIVIARSLFAFQTVDVAEDRLKLVEIEGRQAIVIEPFTAGPITSSSLVLFPEPFGMTKIQTSGVPVDDLMEVARAVAIATK
jgi:hypothetical protein